MPTWLYFHSVTAIPASWRSRVDSGLTPAEQDEFFAWLEADPAHAEHFGEMDATWEVLDRVGELPPASLALPSRPGRAWYRHPAFLASGLAAAAAIAFAAGLYFRAPPPEFIQSAQSEPGYPKRVNLPDGSVVRLNAASEIAVRYTAAERHVDLLRGQAHLQVAKNPDRPFVVSAAQLSVRAVGTAFSVSLRPEALEVLVTEGKVSVNRAGPDASSAPTTIVPILEVGQKVEIPFAPAAPATLLVLPPPEVAQALAWQDRQLEFDSAPLSDIIAEFNRCNAHRIAVAPDSPGLAARRFGGSFRADDPETFLRLLETRADVLIEERAGETVLRLKR